MDVKIDSASGLGLPVNLKEDFLFKYILCCRGPRSKNISVVKCSLMFCRALF